MVVRATAPDPPAPPALRSGRPRRPLARPGAAPAPRSGAVGGAVTDAPGGRARDGAARRDASGSTRSGTCWSICRCATRTSTRRPARRGTRRGEDATVRVRIGRHLRAPDPPAPAAAGRGRASTTPPGPPRRLVQPGATWRASSPRAGVLLRGRLGRDGRRKLVVKTHEVIGGPGSEGLPHQGLVPVYPATEQLPPRRVRELVDLARPYAGSAPERLPAWIRWRLRPARTRRTRSRRSTSRARAARPASAGAAWCSRSSRCSSSGCGAIRRNEEIGRRGAGAARHGALRAALLAALPFPLTAEQQRVTGRDRPRPARTRPMRRLLQGEVGSGKTRRRRARHLPGGRGRPPGRAAGARPRRSPSSTCAPSTRLLAPAGIAPVLVTGRISARGARAAAAGASVGTRPWSRSARRRCCSKGRRSPGSASWWSTSSTASASSSARRSPSARDGATRPRPTCST